MIGASPSNFLLAMQLSCDMHPQNRKGIAVIFKTTLHIVANTETQEIELISEELDSISRGERKDDVSTMYTREMVRRMVDYHRAKHEAALANKMDINRCGNVGILD